VLEDSQPTQNGDIPFDAVGSVAKSFDTVTVEQERHTLALLFIA
jgi:hypothetical protein